MSLAALFSDGRLHHLQAPENTLLPYGTFFKVSDVVEQFTTAYGLRRATLQINVHAETDSQAQAIADSLADQMRTLGGNAGAKLNIYGSTSLHVLPESFGIEIGEGLAPQGKDCWLCFFEIDVLYTK